VEDPLSHPKAYHYSIHPLRRQALLRQQNFLAAFPGFNLDCCGVQFKLLEREVFLKHWMSVLLIEMMRPLTRKQVVAFIHHSQHSLPLPYSDQLKLCCHHC